MHFLKRTAIGITAMAALVVAGCGGAAPAGTDPAGVVNSALAAAESGGFASLTQYACAAQADNVASLFGGGAGSLEQLQGFGIEPNELFDAMKVDFDNVQATETSKSETAATVHVTGTAKMAVDSAKFRELFRKILEAQGVPVDDATLDLAMSTLDSQLSQTQDLNEDVKLIQENGKWVICGS